MSRSIRLLNLLQRLREYRHPVTAQTLAEHLQISVRSVYRDIETLRAQGVRIEAAAGASPSFAGRNRCSRCRGRYRDVHRRWQAVRRGIRQHRQSTHHSGLGRFGPGTDQTDGSGPQAGQDQE